MTNPNAGSPDVVNHADVGRELGWCLCEVPNHSGFAHLALTACQLQLSDEHVDEGGLAAAVPPHHSDARTPLKLVAEVSETEGAGLMLCTCFNGGRGRLRIVLLLIVASTCTSEHMLEIILSSAYMFSGSAIDG